MMNTGIRVSKRAASLLAMMALVAATGDAPATAAIVPAGSHQVTFRSDFSMPAKPLEVVGQYSFATVERTVSPGPAPVESRLDYSTSRQSQVQNTGAQATTCAYGGGVGPACGSPAGTAAAATASGVGMNEVAYNLGLTTAGVYVQISQALASSVQCALVNGQPTLTANRPTGEMRFGNSSFWLGSNGFITKDIATIANGQTWSQEHRMSNRSSAYGKMEITPRWGTDPATNRAYSEVLIRFHAWSGQDIRPWETVRVRTECGLRLNNHTGATSPMATQAMASPALTSPMTASPELLEFREATPIEDLPLTGELHVGDTGVYETASNVVLNSQHIEAVQGALTDYLENGLGTDQRAGTTDTATWQIHSAAEQTDGLPVLEVALHSDDSDKPVVVQLRPQIAAEGQTGGASNET